MSNSRHRGRRGDSHYYEAEPSGTKAESSKPKKKGDSNIFKSPETYSSSSGSDSKSESLNKNFGNKDDGFAAVRDYAYQIIASKAAKIGVTDTPPTEGELNRGIRNRELEPQVEPAVKAMYDKGYVTYSSGFQNDNVRQQEIDGPFRLSKGSVNRIENSGVKNAKVYESGEYSWIRFESRSANLKDIKKDWGKIMDCISPSGSPSKPTNDSLSAQRFRDEYYSSLNYTSSNEGSGGRVSGGSSELGFNLEEV